MAHPEPNGLDDIYGPGADAADAQAAHDEDIVGEIFGEIGCPKNEDEEEWGSALILRALEIGRKEGAESCKPIYCEP